MRGKPDIILVFINLLTHADEDGIVDRHWQTIVDETGLDMDRTKTALAILEAPDPESRTSTQKGRRIMRISPERTWGWQIVNYKFYRSLRTEEERREYMREYMANYRRKQNVNIGKQTLTMLANTDTDTDTDTDKNILSDRYRTEFEVAMKRKERERERKKIVIDSQRQSMTSVSVSVSDPVSEEGDNKGDGSDKEKLAMLAKTETETETKKNILSDQYRTEFEVAWHSYPDKSGKEKAWKAYKLAKPVLSDVLAGLARYVAYVQQRRKTDFADLKFQNGATWFSQSGWMSEWIPSIITKYKGRE